MSLGALPGLARALLGLLAPLGRPEPGLSLLAGLLAPALRTASVAAALLAAAVTATLLAAAVTATLLAAAVTATLLAAAVTAASTGLCGSSIASLVRMLFPLIARRISLVR